MSLSLGIHTKVVGSGSDAKGKNQNLWLMRKPKSLESFYVNRGWVEGMTTISKWEASLGRVVVMDEDLPTDDNQALGKLLACSDSDVPMVLMCSWTISVFKNAWKCLAPDHFKFILVHSYNQALKLPLDTWRQALLFNLKLSLRILC